MSSPHVKYLLVGGGLAASSAAQAIRKLDPRGELTIVGAERIGPYHRPPLSKEYLRQSRRGDRGTLFALPSGWYAENNVRLRTNSRASALDTARRTVALQSGEEIAFDQLLLATGMSPLHLSISGADFPNVYYVRTADDVDRLRHAADKALAEGQRYRNGRGKVAVLGAGVLGVELAASLTQLGLSVELLVSKAHPWHKFAGEHTAGFLQRYLEKHGVSVHTNCRPQRLEGDGRAQRVVISDSAFVTCDFVVAAIGAIPNRELLRGTPITAEKAILVDPSCRTNVEGIYAAGDCAAVLDPLFGKHRVLDHWENASVTGQIAGTNMAGGNARYEAVNHFFSDVFDLSMNAWGESRQVDRRLIRGSTSTDSPDFVEIGIAGDGRIAQVISINHAGEDELLAELVRKRVRVDGNEEPLKDPATPLASLLQ